MAAYLIYECERRERVGKGLLEGPVWYNGNWYEAMPGTCGDCERYPRQHPLTRSWDQVFSLWRTIMDAQEEGTRKLGCTS